PPAVINPKDEWGVRSHFPFQSRFRPRPPYTQFPLLKNRQNRCTRGIQEEFLHGGYSLFF
ncbi:hypothetical protein, partial [Corynebacterium silvaticum]|uniref:hypothetical protein n=1 Tax=Corynebacterium silvaticum TaxID=2320431 RepID=UPI0019D5D326